MTAMVGRVLRVVAYPLLVVGGLAMLWSALEAGMALVWAPFATVAIVGPLVLALERIIPFRPAWDAKPQDYIDDGIFMVVVQVMVPVFLGWALAYALSTALVESDNWFRLWPR